MRYFLATIVLALLVGCGQMNSNKPNAADHSSTPNKAPATSNDNSAEETSTPPADLPKDATPPASSSKTSTEQPGLTDDAKALTGATFDKSKLEVLDQKENQKDIDITANIRKRVVDAKDLSLAAHNVTIITKDGNVTLSGPVKSAAEKQEIERIAHDVAGTTTVNNQLEVK